jgi:trigger factor
VLEAVAREEEIHVTAEDLDREIRSLAEATGREPKEVKKILEKSGQVTSLAGDIIRTKAIDLLVESAEVSREGAPATASDPSRTREDEG